MSFQVHILGFLLGVVLLLVSFAYSNVYSQQLQCSIDMTNVPLTMHPGQYLNLKSNVNSNEEISEYTWTVQGPAIYDYDDDVYNSLLLSAPFNLIPPIPLSSDHLKDAKVSFYWQLDPANENRNVTLNVKNINGETCTDTKTFKVIMGNTKDTQAEDFYVEKNHPILGTTSTDVLQQHRQWHSDYPFFTSTYNNRGDLFFDFHKLYLAHFDNWRKTFGYPTIESWDPGTPLPTGVQNEHTNRNLPYTPLALYSWFTIQPGIDGPDRPLNGWPCETADRPGPDFPAVQDDLLDFEPDQELLGCALTDPYHNDRHVDIGGDMGNPAFAPKDPIFWRYHSFIDDVSEKRFDPHATSAAAAEDLAEVVEENASDNINPRIFSQNPFRLYPYITELPKITEQEKNLFGKTGIEALSAQFTENVTGVKADNFKVNGSPATNVTGSGAGPYVFIGFEPPKYGPINVTLSPGNIADTNGNKFLGDSWNYFLVESGKDSDSDGVEDVIEADVLKTNITKSDSDEDGIVDGIEIVNTCLDPIVNDDSLIMQTMAHGMMANDTGMEGLEEEKPLDYDSDGLSNVEESLANTDPCFQQSSFDSAAGLSEDATITNDTSKSPFILVMQRDGGFTGGNSMLLVDSTSSKSILIDNGNITERQISQDLIETIKRGVNNSQLFEADSFYPPPPGSADHREYSIIVGLNGNTQSVSWTDASEEVPPGVANLPYILDYIFGGSQTKIE